MTEPCKCLDCRIRGAISEPGEFVQCGEAAAALGDILAEVLAHVSDAANEEFIAQLRKARESWKTHPRVAVQRPHEGQA